jgi:sugar phosphate isomerase/epimerase
MKFESLTRREMLGSLAVGAMALRVAKLKAAAPGFKIGVCDWSINKKTNPAALEVAKNIGLDGVMVDMGGVDDDLPLRQPKLQEKYRETIRATGVPVSSIALGVLNQVPLKSDPRAEKWLIDTIQVTHVMGLKVILVPFFGKGDLKGDSRGIDSVIAVFMRVAPLAQRAGVVLGIESLLSADQLAYILGQVNSPALQVYYDVGNSQGAGYDIFKEIRFLGNRICEFHAKDNKDLYGKGSMDFPGVRKAMDDIPYRGWMQIEGSKFPLGVEESVRYDLNYLRGVFPPTV